MPNIPEFPYVKGSIFETMSDSLESSNRQDSETKLAKILEGVGSSVTEAAKYVADQERS